MTFPRRVTPQPPALLFEEEYSDEEEGLNGDAYSPSQLQVKYHESESEDDYYLEHHPRQCRPPPRLPEQGMVAMPASLIKDLQLLLVEYNRRFPSNSSEQPALQERPPPPQVHHSDAPPLPLLLEPDPVASQGEGTVHVDTSEDEQDVRTIPDPNA